MSCSDSAATTSCAGAAVPTGSAAAAATTPWWVAPTATCWTVAGAPIRVRAAAETTPCSAASPDRDGLRSARRHADRAVETHGLAVEVAVGDHQLDQRGELVGVAEALRERHRR